MNTLYSEPELYDWAFSYRNYPAECDFLNELNREFSLSQTNEHPCVLEMAAGPGRHALEFANRGSEAFAIDLSSEMKSYALDIAEGNPRFHYDVADMRSFTLEPIKGHIDIALNMIDSPSLLLETEDFLAHLISVADHVRSGGLYVLEMAHPSTFYEGADRTRSHWSVSKGNRELKVCWGGEKSNFEPLSQQMEHPVTLEVFEGSACKYQIQSISRSRAYTLGELELLVKLSRKWKLVVQYGAFNRTIGLHHEKAWRMISVLRREA